MGTFAILVFVVFPILFFLDPTGKGVNHGDSSITDFVLISLKSMVPTDLGLNVITTSDYAKAIAALEAILGGLFVGLLGTYIVRWSFRR